MPQHIPHKTIERLSLYRRLIAEHLPAGQAHVFSHELAALVKVTPSQVRRDVMITGCYGNPSRGYQVEELLRAINQVVGDADPQALALVGIGKLGSALLGYFHARRPNLKIVAAFDRDPEKVNRLYLGVHCYALDDLPRIAAAEAIYTGIIAVPGPEAQAVAERMVAAGIVGILNFAPAPLRVPPPVYVETIDVTTSLEKVAFYARRAAQDRAGRA